MTHSTDVANTIGMASSAFVERYGYPATICGAAPGRVNLIGGHVDYQDGIVIPFAIDRYSVVVGMINDSSRARLFSSHSNEWAEWDLSLPLRPHAGHWSNYVAGVIVGFQQRGVELRGFDALVHSTVPIGSGLSSSASLEVAMASFLESAFSSELPKLDKAELCRQAEVEFVGMPCGIMDQIASVYGEADRLVKIDCRSHAVELIEWPGQEVSVLVVDSGASHRLVEGKYAERRSQSASALRKLGLESYRDLTPDQLESVPTELTAIEHQRARHVVSEIQRAQQFTQSIAACRWKDAGQLLYGSHRSLCEDYAVSCQELDYLVGIAKQIGTEEGVWGARMMGGGFGGSVVMLVQTQSLAAISNEVTKRYDSITGNRPACFVTRPSPGAFHCRFDR